MTTGSESATHPAALPPLEQLLWAPELVSEEAQPRHQIYRAAGRGLWKPPTASAAAGAHARGEVGVGLRLLAAGPGPGRAETSGPGSSRPPFIWIPTELSFLP